MNIAPSRFDLVEEPFLGPRLVRCPLCGSHGERRPAVVLQRAPFVEMSTCTACHGSSASRMPTAEFLRAYYDPSRYASYMLSHPRLVDRFAAHVVSRLALPGHADLEILDFGGNDGSLARAMAKLMRTRGHRGRLRFTVVDLFERPSTEDVRYQTVEAFLASEDHYHAVLASAVLEHLTEFRTIVRALLRACHHGAQFYGRTPYEVSLHRLVPGYRVKWPGHVHDLGPRFWGSMLEKLGASGTVLHSAPSPVESRWTAKPLRTAIARALKLPAQVEALVRGPDALSRGGVWWSFVGGWEAVLRVTSATRDGAGS